jgi:hypothetical protein
MFKVKSKLLNGIYELPSALADGSLENNSALAKHKKRNSF